jgi:SAM-dependent methyltransferase
LIPVNLIFILRKVSMTDYQEKPVEFWNRRAKTFPKHDDDKVSYANDVIAKIEDSGISFSGKTVLDVGAGSGQFTLKLAQKAKAVTALDISDQMLAFSKADALRLGLNNIEYILSPLIDYQPAERFDLAFCSMCPAVRDETSRRWLFNIAKEAVIFLGFIKYIDPGPMTALMSHYGLEHKTFNSGPDMERWLTEAGQTFRAYPLTGEWRVYYEREDAFQWCLTLLGDYGVTDPDPQIIKSGLEPFWDQAANKYIYKTPYFVDLIIWEREKNRGLPK